MKYKVLVPRKLFKFIQLPKFFWDEFIVFDRDIHDIPVRHLNGSSISGIGKVSVVDLTHLLSEFPALIPFQTTVAALFAYAGKSHGFATAVDEDNISRIATGDIKLGDPRIEIVEKLPE